jgi:capsular exopolysaccharide synthesis family protein
MRRPSIHRSFGLQGKTGLSNLLTGDAEAKDVIQATIQSNLFVITAGPVPPHPSELLSSSRMQNCMLQWLDTYDHIVVDSPPVVSVTDAVLLSAQMDTVLLVIRSGQTTAAHVRRARNLLQSVMANLLGIVVNAADFASPDYYYYGSRYRYYVTQEESEGKADRKADESKDESA